MGLRYFPPCCEPALRLSLSQLAAFKKRRSGFSSTCPEAVQQFRFKIYALLLYVIRYGEKVKTDN